MWDERLEGLYGLAAGAFDSSFTMYESLLHPEDRELVLGSVRSGMQRNVPWRFDHRVVWPDGSVHWLEGRGEPVYDRSGAIVGASGVTINIDARHVLLDAETRAKRGRRTIVGRRAEPGRDLDRARRRSNGRRGRRGDRRPRRATRCTPGRATSRPSTCRPTSWSCARSRATPTGSSATTRASSLEAPVPGVEAISTGEPIFIESPEHRRERYPQYADDPTHEAFVVLPLAPLAGARAVLAFGFAEPRRFDDDDRSYIARRGRGVRPGAPAGHGARGAARDAEPVADAARQLRTARRARRSRPCRGDDRVACRDTHRRMGDGRQDPARQHARAHRRRAP